MNTIDHRLLLLIQLIPTLMMTGVIWTVQLVQYPLFELIKGENLTTFHQRYTRRISWVVLPLMLSELAAALICSYLFPNFISILLLGILFVIWVSTFVLSVPLHRQVALGDREIMKRLVTTNWPRTIGWSARAIILVYTQLI